MVALPKQRIDCLRGLQEHLKKAAAARFGCCSVSAPPPVPSLPGDRLEFTAILARSPVNAAILVYKTRMPLVQIVAVTTAEIGPSGPIKKIYAVGLETVGQALDEMEKRLKPGESASWLDARNLNLSPGEVRLI